MSGIRVTRLDKLGVTAQQQQYHASGVSDVVPQSPRSKLTADVQRGGSSLAFFAFTVSALGVRGASAAAVTEDDFIGSLATIITCKRILAPVQRFVSSTNYDAGRTNVNYMLNFLKVQKVGEMVVKAGLEFAENPDAIDVAVESSAQLSNTLIQLDSSIYTVIFIPGDDSSKPPPAAEKYIKMIDGYYKDSIGRFDSLLSLAGEEQIKKATAKSDNQFKELQKTQPFLFKDVKKAEVGFDPSA